MSGKWIVIAAALLAAWPPVVAAQRPPRPARTPRAFAYAFSDHHGRIGVIVKTDPDPETDKIGAAIDGVTPGGPAAKAGLKAGDLITSFNGTSLAGVEPEDEDESGPGSKLVELAHRLEPGDTVRIEYRRGGDTKTATLVAEDLGARFDFTMPRIEWGPGMPDVCFGDRWCDLDLVTLNADLGEYFGTREGVLVVKAPADSAMPLRSGDVILSIGGRKPASPSHAMRILRSYEPGETVTLDVMRKQKRMTLTWTVPQRGEGRLRRLHPPERDDQSDFRRRPLIGRWPVQRVV